MRTPCASIFVSEILQKQIYFTLVHILPIDAEQQISPRLFLLKYIFSFIFHDFASTDRLQYVNRLTSDAVRARDSWTVNISRSQYKNYRILNYIILAEDQINENLVYGLKMGLNSSTMLRDEDINQIKQETGCK